MEPYKCPVCNGCGKVEYNFYKDKSELGFHEECRTCKGEGVLWDNNKEPAFNYYPLLKDDTTHNRYDPCETCPVRQQPNWNGICHCTLGNRGNVIW